MNDFPNRGRLLGIDAGEVRIGLAVCDADWMLASPLETLTRQNPERDAESLRGICRREEITGLIVGLPVSLNETEGPKAAECRAFGDWLHRETSLPVRFQDERFTTALAEDVLRDAKLTHKQRKARRDMLAAQQILQNWLDTARLDRTRSAL